MSKQVLQYQLGELIWKRREHMYFSTIGDHEYGTMEEVLVAQGATPLPSTEESKMLEEDVVKLNEEFSKGGSLPRMFSQQNKAINQLLERVKQLEKRD